MQVYDPTAPGPDATQNMRRAVGDLRGKVIGFIDNSKPNFNHLAADLGELLVKHHGVARVIHHRKRAASVPALESVYADIEANVDLVITGSGD